VDLDEQVAEAEIIKRFREAGEFVREISSTCWRDVLESNADCDDIPSSDKLLSAYIGTLRGIKTFSKEYLFVRQCRYNPSNYSFQMLTALIVCPRRKHREPTSSHFGNSTRRTNNIQDIEPKEYALYALLCLEVNRKLASHHPLL
jgi:hypothetical protein